ncbi:hypothetical protein HPB51_000171 [Rhipicephalus microplus]|uniref:Reverse transcriptase domain-containing protein n=1 Tax=Rhipicephalus microplus TaxID=6941 RepID=A0A9J6EQG0_RHIMP|nr:hypothetical protein HPB51_000171 [Rhipicephalus microplus]
MPEGVLVQAYADDTVVIIPGTTRIALGDKGSEVLRRVERWAIMSKVTLSREKTCCVLFSQGVGGMERVRLSIRAANSEKSLKFVDILRVLGVVFDRRLFFFAHADHLKEKVNHLAAKVVTFKNMAETRSETICHVRAQVFWPNMAGTSPLPARSGQWSTAGQTVGPYTVLCPRNEKTLTEQPERLPRTTASISRLELCQIQWTRRLHHTAGMKPGVT